jgi:hypothetical protein
MACVIGFVPCADDFWITAAASSTTSCAGLTRASIFLVSHERMDGRAFAAPKGLWPRRRGKPAVALSPDCYLISPFSL